MARPFEDQGDVYDACRLLRDDSLVWSPDFELMRKRLADFLEAAATFDALRPAAASFARLLTDAEPEF